jgi:hypothetical protein
VDAECCVAATRLSPLTRQEKAGYGRFSNIVQIKFICIRIEYMVTGILLCWPMTVTKDQAPLVQPGSRVSWKSRLASSTSIRCPSDITPSPLAPCPFVLPTPCRPLVTKPVWYPAMLAHDSHKRSSITGATCWMGRALAGNHDWLRLPPSAACPTSSPAPPAPCPSGPAHRPLMTKAAPSPTHPATSVHRPHPDNPKPLTSISWRRKR